MPMMAARRGASFLGIAALGGILAFLLGLLGGQPDGWAVWLYLSGSSATTAIVVVMALRLIPVTGKEEGPQAALVPLFSAVLGGLLLAGFAAAFVLGIFVCFEEGWGDRGLQGDLGGIDMSWQSWLSKVFRVLVLGGGVVGAYLGLLAWVSRLVRIGGGDVRRG